MFYFIQRLLNRDPIGAARSSKWPVVEHQFLKDNPTCAVCGEKGKIVTPLNVHHCQSFSRRPELELDPTNLITLCRPHHLLCGHLMNWASQNDAVRDDAYHWLYKISHKP